MIVLWDNWVLLSQKVEKGINDDLRHFLAIFRVWWAPKHPRGSPIDNLVSHEKLRGTILLRDDPNTEKIAKSPSKMMKNLKNNYTFAFICLIQGPKREILLKYPTSLPNIIENEMF